LSIEGQFGEQLFPESVELFGVVLLRYQRFLVGLLMVIGPASDNHIHKRRISACILGRHSFGDRCFQYSAGRRVLLHIMCKRILNLRILHL